MWEKLAAILDWLVESWQMVLAVLGASLYLWRIAPQVSTASWLLRIVASGFIAVSIGPDLDPDNGVWARIYTVAIMLTVAVVLDVVVAELRWLATNPELVWEEIRKRLPGGKK